MCNKRQLQRLPSPVDTQLEAMQCVWHTDMLHICIVFREYGIKDVGNTNTNSKELSTRYILPIKTVQNYKHCHVV